MAITIRPEEFPAGYTLSAMLDVKNIHPTSVLRVACSDDVGAHTTLHVGEQTNTSTLQQLSPDQLFLSVDTSALPAGCSLQAVIDNGKAGKSQPFTLAHIVRLPQIDSFEITADPAVNGMRAYTLTGRNLEMIGKVGWNQSNGVDVNDLPAPIPGQGQKQSLRIQLPDAPTAQAPLYLWVRGENTGRLTTVLAPAGTPLQLPPPPNSIQPATLPTAAAVQIPIGVMPAAPPPR